MKKIIGKIEGEEIYLVAIDERMGQLAFVEAKVITEPQLIGQIVKQGYVEEVADDQRLVKEFETYKVQKLSR